MIIFQDTCIGNRPYFKSFLSLDDLFCLNLGDIQWNMPEEGRRAKGGGGGGGGGGRGEVVPYMTYTGKSHQPEYGV